MTHDDLQCAIAAGAGAVSDAAKGWATIDAEHLKVLLDVARDRLTSTPPPDQWFQAVPEWHGPESAPLADRVWSTTNFYAAIDELGGIALYDFDGDVITRFNSGTTPESIAAYCRGRSAGFDLGEQVGRRAVAGQVCRAWASPS